MEYLQRILTVAAFIALFTLVCIAAEWFLQGNTLFSSINLP